MTLEDTSEVRFELSDLNYLCSHASLACKGFLEMIATAIDKSSAQSDIPHLLLPLRLTFYDPLSCEASLATKKNIILLKKTNLINSTLTTSQFCNKNISPREALQSLQMPKDRGGTAMGTGGTKLRSFLKKLIDETKFLDDLVK